MAKDDPHFRLRIPAELKDRIAAVAKTNNRSINAEIVYTLDNAYPEPITIAEIADDIQGALRILRRFGGVHTLSALADSLDQLMVEIGKSKEGTEEDRQAATEHVEKHGKFNRYVPPTDF